MSPELISSPPFVCDDRICLSISGLLSHLIKLCTLSYELWNSRDDWPSLGLCFCWTWPFQLVHPYPVGRHPLRVTVGSTFRWPTKKKEELNQDVGQVLWLVGRWFNETVELMTADGEGGSRRCKTRFLSSVEVAFIDGRVPLRVCQMGFLVGIPGMPRSWWSKTNEKWELLGWNF